MTPDSLSPFDLLVPAKIHFGWGRFPEVGSAAARLGRRAFLVTGSRTLSANGTVAELVSLLRKQGVEPIELASIHHEPEVADVDRAAADVRGQGVRSGDLVIGLGGGSALDLAKAVAALATNTATSSVLDYLEGVGAGLQLTMPPLPLVAIPTTAGTGSEATKNAVISSYNPPFKKSLRHDDLVPRVVVVDPRLTVGLSRDVTAHSGLDAITQLIESYISCKARPIPRALAMDGLRRALPSIVEAVENGSSRTAREAMSYAALLSGIALANSGLGMAHGVAAALGSRFRVPHGLACAVMLPVALAANRECSLGAMADMARATGLSPREPSTAVDSASRDADAADALIEHIRQICQRVGATRRLSQWGIRESDLPDLVRDSHGNSLSGNPREIPDAELLTILRSQL